MAGLRRWYGSSVVFAKSAYARTLESLRRQSGAPGADEAKPLDEPLQEAVEAAVQKADRTPVSAAPVADAPRRPKVRRSRPKAGADIK